jgi:hypothetical protein
MSEPDPTKMKQALEQILVGLEGHSEDRDIPPGLSPASVVAIARRGLDPDPWQRTHD